LNQFIGDLRLMFGEKIVAAENRRDDFAGITEGLLERAAGTDRTFFDARTDIAFFLAADLGEELIQVMHYAQFVIHAMTSSVWRLGRDNSQRREARKEKVFYLSALAPLREISPKHF